MAELRETHPLLFDVISQISRTRLMWNPIFGPSDATIEVWFSIEIWSDFCDQLHDRPELGCVSVGGEPYGAMCAGAECFSLFKAPVDGPFQLRLRLEK